MHRFIPAEDSPPILDLEQQRVVKRWVREILKLPADTTVLLQESPCADPACPLVESVISVFEENGATRSWRFTRPRAAITKQMLLQSIVPAK